MKEMRHRVIPVDTKHVLKARMVKDVLHVLLVCNHASVVFLMCLKNSTLGPQHAKYSE